MVDNKIRGIVRYILEVHFCVKLKKQNESLKANKMHGTEKKV